MMSLSKQIADVHALVAMTIYKSTRIYQPTPVAGQHVDYVSAPATHAGYNVARFLRRRRKLLLMTVLPN